ncbi:MAG: 4Fe-4S dicluster-binding protein [Bacteroidota bacterium]
MNVLQKIGLGLFVLALLIFTVMLGLNQYQLTAETTGTTNEYHQQAILDAASANGMLNTTYATSFEFVAAYKKTVKTAAENQQAKVKAGLPEGVSAGRFKIGSWNFKPYAFEATKQSAIGPVVDHPLLFLGLTFGLAILGGLIYMVPIFQTIPGIKHNHMYHSAMTRGLRLAPRSFFLGSTIVGVLLYGAYYMNKMWFWPMVTMVIMALIIGLVLLVEGRRKNQPARSAAPELTGWLGVLTGVYLIGFYILLYWAPQHITSWIIMVDPVSRSLSGGAASQWFLYGLLYTVIVLVMGIRMMAKYRHNNYQMVRTGSVMFFQTAFAFLLPEILVRLNQPWYDFKNIWPLNYTFFFDWNIKNLTNSGNLGLFMFVWGIALIVVGVPLFTYFFGKRWYCSWVCGCGGLAETMGDPYRQLSDKSVKAWQFERWIIHGVLVFAVIMTMGVLYSFLPKDPVWYSRQNFLLLMMALLTGVMTFAYLRWRQGKVDISRTGIYVGWGVTFLLVGVSAYHLFEGSDKFLFLSSGTTRQWYGFLIGSAFAGVVGTGFYPLMGNRVWCRFGCPLAAYLGLVQRFKSKFRITVNGSQCISCGNCSTYCEMGIDVRHYAQRGQDVVRSSCVGCGVCAAVCPRGVLRLENSALDVDSRTEELRTIHISEGEVRILS